jgi:hypothetical protein
VDVSTLVILLLLLKMLFVFVNWEQNESGDFLKKLLGAQSTKSVLLFVPFIMSVKDRGFFFERISGCVVRLCKLLSPNLRQW